MEAGQEEPFNVQQTRLRVRAGAVGSGEMRAPMPGLIVYEFVVGGETVTNGQKLLVLEAMKTQQPFVAPLDCQVTKLAVEKGGQAVDGATLIVVSATE